MKRKGFTIVELVMVFSIICLIVFPIYEAIIKNKSVTTNQMKGNYNRVDVEVFCKEQNCSTYDFYQSKVLQKRYKNWLNEELTK
jgi:Tfp pilus assembly major pilin PilA